MSYYKAKNKKKTKRSWYTYLPLVFLIALVCNGLIIFTQVSKTVHENAKVAPPKSVKVSIGGREYNNLELSDNDYRQMARNLDDEILEAYRYSRIAQTKESRRARFVDYNEDPEMYNQERIRSMRDELEREFSEREASEEGSIAFELKKTIERMENAPR